MSVASLPDIPISWYIYIVICPFGGGGSTLPSCLPLPRYRVPSVCPLCATYYQPATGCHVLSARYRVPSIISALPGAMYYYVITGCQIIAGPLPDASY